MKQLIPPPVYRLQLHRKYDIERAELDEWYTLEEWKRVGLFRRRWEWRPVQVRSLFGMGYPAQGSFQWARRISKEFCIDLPVW